MTDKAKDLQGALTLDFEKPNTESFQYIAKDFLENREPAIKTHTTANTFGVFTEPVKENFESLERAWNIRPKNFESIDSANGYLSHVGKALSAAKSFIDQLAARWLELERHQYVMFKDNFVYTLIQVLGGAFIAYQVFEKNINNNYHWAAAGVLGILWGTTVYFVLGILFIAFDWPFRKRRKNRFDKNPPDLPRWIKDFQQDVLLFRSRVDAAKAEIYSDIEVNKRLIEEIKRRQIDDHFQEKTSKRSLAERIEIMQAEVRAAIENAKTLEEQHERTEAIRLKYTRELVELQRQVKAEDNQDLTQKLALLESALNDGETL